MEIIISSNNQKLELSGFKLLDGFLMYKMQIPEGKQILFELLAIRFAVIQLY